MIIVTITAVLVLAAALMIVTSKTNRRRDGVTIHELVDDDVMMVRRHEALADELEAGAQAAEVEIETAAAVQRRTIPWS